MLWMSIVSTKTLQLIACAKSQMAQTLDIGGHKKQRQTKDSNLDMLDNTH